MYQGSYAPQAPYSAGGGYGGARARLGPGDLIQMMLREIWLMAAVFSVVAMLGIAFAFTLERTYEAQARLSVLLGDEYVFTPRAGAAAEGSTPKQEQIVQSEVEVIKSIQVAERAVRDIGLETLFEPEDLIVREGAPSEEARFSLAVYNFQREFYASATPNTTVITLGFRHKDPQIAARTLNTLIDEYLAYRKEVLFEDRSGPLAAQRNEFEVQLEAVEAEMSGFLAANGVADFEAERAAVQGLLSTTRAELLNVQSRASEARGRLAATTGNFNREPGEVRQSFETDNSRRRIELQQQLEDLRTRYTEQSQPVQDQLRRIEALERLLNSPEGQAAGVTKTGPNPVRDTLAADRARADADVEALVQREAVLDSQVAQLQARAVALANAKPQFDDMVRRKAVLEEQVRQFASREATARAQNELNQSGNDNIRVIQRAEPPARGSSLRRPAAAAALLLAALTALAAGLMRALSRRSFPTPASVGRTLGVPVLATVTR
jgi:uncharacterized protein involved in exopolysaccharide biosynthesis